MATRFHPYGGSQPHASTHQPLPQNAPGYVASQTPLFHQHTSQNQEYPQSQPANRQDPSAHHNQVGYFTSPDLSGDLPDLSKDMPTGIFDNYTPDETYNQIESMLDATTRQPSGRGNEEVNQMSKTQTQGETVNRVATNPSNFLNRDLEDILKKAPFLHEDTPLPDIGAYHIADHTVTDDGITFEGFKTNTLKFESCMSESQFEHLLDIFRNVDKLIEGKHLNKREYLMRIELLGLLINLNWKIKNPPMQVRVWREMEQKLACRKNKIFNKEANH